jgi:hypothetical protein
MPLMQMGGMNPQHPSPILDVKWEYGAFVV